MRKCILLLVLGLLVLGHYSAMAGNAAKGESEIETVNRYQKEMRGLPDVVSPDSVYTGYSLDRLYYQNQQTAQVLEGMRNLLQKMDNSLKGILKLEDEAKKTNTDSLYYQNLEIISVLKDIRGLLRESSDKVEKK